MLNSTCAMFFCVCLQICEDETSVSPRALILTFVLSIVEKILDYAEGYQIEIVCVQAMPLYHFI